MSQVPHYYIVRQREDKVFIGKIFGLCYNEGKIIPNKGLKIKGVGLINEDFKTSKSR